MKVSFNKSIGEYYLPLSHAPVVVKSHNVEIRCLKKFRVSGPCSAVWCSAADTHLKLLDRAVSGVRFLTMGMFACDIAHRRSVAVLCMLHKIRCNLMHPLNGAKPGSYVPVVVTGGALLANRYTYAPPRCRTSQYRRTCIYFPLSAPKNDLASHVFDGVRLTGFKGRANAFLLA